MVSKQQSRERRPAIKPGASPIHAGLATQNSEGRGYGRAALGIVVIALLLLSGCTYIKGNPKNYNRYQGTDGVNIRFLDNAPPAEVYESRPFPVKFELYDAGAQDVSYDKLLVTFSTDPLYMKVDDRIDVGINPFDVKKYDEAYPRRTQIFGRSELYPQGEKRYFGIPSEAAFEAKAVPGQRESPQTELVASVCYAYKTYAAAEVCIDTNIYQQNERRQSCKQQDVMLSGGQGAPIAVTQIEVQALPMIGTARQESVRPQFIIHIEDTGYGRGDGYLIGPDTLEFSSACLLKDIPKEKAGAVRLSASLMNTKLICGQGRPKDTESFVKLLQGKAEVTCTVPEDETSNPIYSSTQNFMTSLSINITYIYKTSTAKTLSIQRLEGSRDFTPTGNENGQTTGYAYENGMLVRDENGYPVPLCNYYQVFPEKIPNEVRTQGFKERIAQVQAQGKSFSCACSKDRCAEIGKGINCFLGLCGGASECCTDPPKTTTRTGTGTGTGTGSGAGTGAGSGTGSGAGDGSGGGTGSGASATDSCYQGDLGIIPKIGANPTKQQINDALEAAERKYGIPTDLLKAMAYQENQNWATTSCHFDVVGDSCGLMQINKHYHPDYDQRLGGCEVSYNINFGAKLLFDLHKETGDWYTAVRRYNGSPTNPATKTYADSVMRYQQSKPWVKAFGVQ